MGYWSTLFLSYLLSPLTWFFFALGAIFGSFLNVCIVRIPEEKFFSKARSHCPQCQRPIPWYLNIPILSYVYLRGKARCCGARIFPRYLFVELLTAILFVMAYWKFPFFSGNILSTTIHHKDFLRFLHAIVLICLLIVCSFIDLAHMIIPDMISLPMIAVTPLVVYFHPDLDWQSAAIGVIAGGFVLYGIAWLYFFIRREIGMGFGDVKLLAAIGGWLGYQGILPTILYGSVIGSVYGISLMAITRKTTMKSAIPFGPFLAIGAIIHLFYGGQVQEWFNH